MLRHPRAGERRTLNPGRGPVAPAAPPPEAALGGERSPGDGGAATRQRQAPAPAPSSALPLLLLLPVVVVPLLLCALRGAAAPAPPPCSRTRSRAGSSRCSTASAASRCRSGTRRCGARRGRRARGEPRVPPPQPWVPPPRVASPPGRSRGACPAPPPGASPLPDACFGLTRVSAGLAKSRSPPEGLRGGMGTGTAHPACSQGQGARGCSHLPVLGLLRGRLWFGKGSAACTQRDAARLQPG